MVMDFVKISWYMVQPLLHTCLKTLNTTVLHLTTAPLEKSKLCPLLLTRKTLTQTQSKQGQWVTDVCGCLYGQIMHHCTGQNHQSRGSLLTGLPLYQPRLLAEWHGGHYWPGAKYFEEAPARIFWMDNVEKYYGVVCWHILALHVPLVLLPSEF